MRGWLAFGLVCVLFLSGCAQKVDTTGDGITASATSPHGGVHGNVSFTPPANHAPTAQLNASVLTGAAPLLVNFTLGGSDLDNATLTWTLAFLPAVLGNATATNATSAAAPVQLNGTGLPASVNHTFLQAGNQAVVLTVSDGKLQANATLTIVVLPGGPSGPKQDDITLSDSVMCLPTIVVNGEISGGSHTFTVNPGQRTMTLTLAYDETVGVEDMDLAVTDATGATTESGESGQEPPLVFAAPAAGEWTVAVTAYSCALTADYTISIVFA
jgi:hypothetical protein